MKIFLHLFSLILFCFNLLFLSPTPVYAQKSAAELIATVPPPKGRVQYKDGARKVNIRDNYLFITNFWAGLQVVDISDIQNPRQVAFLSSDDEAYYTDIDDQYAYLANHATGVQVYDIRDVNNIVNVAEIETPGNVYWAVADFPHLFVAMGDTGFAIMDITDLANPRLVKQENPPEWIQQVYKKGDLLFLAAKKDGMLIYDISELENPRRLSHFTTEHNSMMVQVVENVAYIADGSGGMVAVQVEDPRNPLELKRYSDFGFVGNLHKVGNYAYLANRDMGLQIVNVADPANPFLEGRYFTEDISYGVYKRDIYVFLAANTSTLIMRHNNAPVLQPLANAELQENALHTLQLQAREPDGDAIVYEALNLPDGATFDTQSGLFSWTPTYEQSGRYSNVIFRVIEQTGSQLTASDTIALLVEHVNRLPDLPALENRSVDENTALQFTIPPGSDPDREDQNRLTYRAERLPQGASFDPNTRVFNWVPTYEQSGVYIVDFLIDDGAGGIDREPLTIVVEHVDRKPIIAAISEQVVEEAQTLTVQLSGTELDREDQDKISFRMENLPPGAAFDPNTQVFRWTPTYEQSGVYADIRGIMIAGNLSDTTIFAINVQHVNRPPVLAAVVDQSVAENTLLTFSISGSDPDREDQGKLVYSAANLPEGAAFDPAGRVFQWTPSYEQSGQYPDIVFTVADPAGLTDSRSIAIAVDHVNRPPQIAAVDPQTVNENTPLQFQLSAVDPDREDAGKLTFFAEQLPEGATLNPQSGAFEWTPSYEQSGKYDPVFIVSDGQYKDSSRTQITVVHVNRPPQLAAIAAQTVDENQLLSFTIQGEDPDREDSGLLSFRATELPEGATFDAAAQTFSWSPTYEQSGQYTVSFVVDDPAGLSDPQEVEITVNHVNRSPVLAAIEDQSVDENQLLEVQLSGSDPDREDEGQLVYAIDTLPEGARLDQQTGMLSWTPDYEQSGIYQVSARVTDPAGLSADQSFAITVNHVNRPPQLADLQPQAGAENVPLRFDIQSSDPDEEDQGKLVYRSDNLPDGASLNSSSGAFSWTPSFEQSGTYSLTFQVSDGFNARDSLTVPVTITHVNRTPALPAVANATFQENVPATLVVPEGSDPDEEDRGSLTYSVENLPEGANFDSATRTLSWTPGYEQSGEYQLTAVVQDSAGLSATQPFTMVVEHVNRPPEVVALAPQSGRENEALEFSVQGSDPDREDQGQLTYRSPDLPEGAALGAASGVFSWTPGYEQSGSYPVTFTVADPAGETAQTATTIEIAHVNRPPVMAEAPGYSFTENTAAQYTLPEGSDPDAEDAGQLSYAMESLPEGANFDPATRTLSWTPTYEQSGEYQAVVLVKDPQGLSASQTVTLSVEHVNRPPQVAALAPQSGRENQALEFAIQGSDPDREDEGQLTYRSPDLPEGAALGAASGVFSWTPGYEQSGSYPVTFTVADPAGETAQTATTIEIAHVNRPPVMAEAPGYSFTENTAAQYTLPEGSDPDAEDAGQLSYAMESLPEGANFDPATRTLSWTPTYEQSGEYQAVVLVKDPQGLSASQTVTLSVEHVNRPPEVAALAPQSGRENEALEFSVQGSDPDREDEGQLTYRSPDLPEGATLGAASGVFSWTPGYEQSGSYPVTFTVADPAGETAQTATTIEIAHVNQPPAFSGTKAFRFRENEQEEVRLPEAQDADREDENALSYRVEGLPEGASFDSATRQISWKPGFEQAGSYTVAYIVSDGTTENRTEISLEVEDSNRAPEMQIPADQSLKEGETLAFGVSASDPDSQDSDQLQIEVKNLPEGARFQNGQFEWTPGSAQQGSYEIEFVVRDPQGASAKATVSIAVEDVPDPAPQETGDGGETPPQETPEP